MLPASNNVFICNSSLCGIVYVSDSVFFLFLSLFGL
jgi:hypothetical protein